MFDYPLIKLIDPKTSNFMSLYYFFDFSLELFFIYYLITSYYLNLGNYWRFMILKSLPKILTKFLTFDTRLFFFFLFLYYMVSYLTLTILKLIKKTTVVLKEKDLSSQVILYLLKLHLILKFYFEFSIAFDLTFLKLWFNINSKVYKLFYPCFFTNTKDIPFVLYYYPTSSLVPFYIKAQKISVLNRFMTLSSSSSIYYSQTITGSLKETSNFKLTLLTKNNFFYFYTAKDYKWYMGIILFFSFLNAILKFSIFLFSQCLTYVDTYETLEINNKKPLRINFNLLVL